MGKHPAEMNPDELVIAAIGWLGIAFHRQVQVNNQGEWLYGKETTEEWQERVRATHTFGYYTGEILVRLERLQRIDASVEEVDPELLRTAQNFCLMGIPDDQ